MINEEILEKITNALDISCKNVIEVGPGYGALTEKLLSKNPSCLELVELDKNMIEIIRKRLIAGDFLNSSKININNIDILKYKPEFNDYIVVANIPYYITSPILTHFFYNLQFQPSDMIILMQRDVADKIRKISGNKNSVLSLGADFACFEITEITRVPSSDFVPSPKIESSVLHFKLRQDIDKDLSKRFLKLIKSGFAEKRKKLSSNLVKIGGYDKSLIERIFLKLGLSDNTRAEELDLTMWNKVLLEIGN